MTQFRPHDDEHSPRTQTGVWTTRVPTARQPSTDPTVDPSAATGPGPARGPNATWPWLQRNSALRLAVRWALRSMIAVAGCIALLLFAYRWVAPPTSMLMLAQRLAGTRIEQHWQPLDRISPHLARAVIMSEDAGFCSHRGVDWKEIERVYEQSLEGGATGGGSTISMQVIKNLFLWSQKSYLRKAIEIPLTLVADRWWGKQRMLEFYLNIAEWGPGLFGAEAAARAYFNKPAAALTEGEAALLAVALPNPVARNAAAPSARQRRMAMVVQGRMKAGANNVRCLPRPTR